MYLTRAITLGILLVTAPAMAGEPTLLQRIALLEERLARVELQLGGSPEVQADAPWKTATAWQGLTRGMTEADVVALLGRFTQGQRTSEGVTVLLYHDGRLNGGVSLLNGRVQHWQAPAF